MLKLIAKFVGKPRDDSELAFVTNPKAQKFMEDLPEYPPADLRRRFPTAGADAVDLLARMLVMRPDRRLSVEEALRHPYLRSLRDKKVTVYWKLSLFLIMPSNHSWLVQIMYFVCINISLTAVCMSNKRYKNVLFFYMSVATSQVVLHLSTFLYYTVSFWWGLFQIPLLKHFVDDRWSFFSHFRSLHR